jgi:hypothetical protein
MNTAQDEFERRLQERLLLEARVEGDRLVLDDATLRAALDGSRPLTANERAALQASPLTVRRLRRLALDARARPAQAAWRGSGGMLRAASSGGIEALRTDDGWWTLHVVRAGDGWRTILQLAPQAPFAPDLLAARAPVRVLDGGGAGILSGLLDADGECEAAWPHAQDPVAWLKAHGAAFRVEPA